MSAQKELLGVRETTCTCNDLVLIAAGVSNSKNITVYNNHLISLFGKKLAA